MAGYEIVTIPTADYGDMDLDAFRAAMSDQVAAVMMTCPNTLGIFNPYIAEICDVAEPITATNDAVLMIEPRFAGTMWRNTARQHR